MDGKSPAPPEPGTNRLSEFRGRLGGGAGAIAELVNAGRPADKPSQQQQRSRRGGSTDGVRRVTPPPGPVPLAKQVKDVLQYLQEAEGEPRSWQEMTAAPQLQRYDLSPDGELARALRVNPRVVLVGESMLAYRSEHGITNKTELLEWLRGHPSGTRLPQIMDAYRAVEADVEEALKEGLLYKIFNYDAQCFVLFPVDVALVAAAHMDEDVLALYKGTQVPDNPADLQAALTEMGLPSRLAGLNRKRVTVNPNKKEGRKKRGFNIAKATNVHLAHLLKSDGPTAIDKLPEGH